MEKGIVFYSNKQVEKLLNEILDTIPDNDNRLVKTRKAIKMKIENLDKHI